MVQKYKRLVIGSVDPENIARYQAKLDEWQGKLLQGIANSENGGIINSTEQFNTTDDPMREAFGAGLISNEAEIKQIIKNLNESNVEIEYRDNAMCYQPGLIKGKPGRFVIDPKASYSAWLHEYTHFLDDKADGFLGMSVFENSAKCVEREIHAYEIEIKMAEKLKRFDLAERLKLLLKEEVKKYGYAKKD